MTRGMKRSLALMGLAMLLVTACAAPTAPAGTSAAPADAQSQSVVTVYQSPT